MLAKSNLNSIEKLLSQALIDLEISHEEFKTIVNEEENYRRLKENIRMMKMSEKIVEICKIKKKNFSMYKMAKISLEAYKKLCVNTVTLFYKK